MLDVLKQTLESNAQLIAGVKDTQYGGKTPCTDFDTRALINHMVMANYFIASCGDPNVKFPENPDACAGDPVAAFRAGAAVALKTIEGAGPDTTFKFPFGEMPAAQAVGIALMENTVHRWDLTKALGEESGIDPQLASGILEGARAGIGPELRGEGGPFGPEVQVPDDASPVDKLVAFLGRTP